MRSIARSVLMSVATVALLSFASARAEPVNEAASAEELTPKAIATLVKQLDANAFAQRQKASEKLFAAGGKAIPALEKAAQGDSLEVTTRSIEILKKHLKTGTDETKTAAKAALEALAKCDKPAVAPLEQEHVGAAVALDEAGPNERRGRVA